MFYRECELLANEHPEINPLIKKVDSLLHLYGSTGLFRPEDIASQLGEKESQIDGIFLTLVEAGLITKEHWLECPHCYNLIEIGPFEKAREDEDPFECSQCQAEIVKLKLKEVETYRMSPAKTQNKVLVGQMSIANISDSPTLKINEEIEVKHIHVSQPENDWVRIGLVQIDFAPIFIEPPDEFGYVLSDFEKGTVNRKIFSALTIAHQEKANIICFPELSFASEWVEEIQRDFEGPIIVGGSYYENRFNICPIIIQGTAHHVKKINPSPNAEGDVASGRGMRIGKEIDIFQTKYGSFAVLICLDYIKEVNRILGDKNKTILDFIINPCYNKDVENFQQQANLDCQKANYPYILQINEGSTGEKKHGGTCIIGTDHVDALERYSKEGFRPKNDPIKYKLLQAEGEMMLLADLDIRKKGVRLPASGLKMKGVCRYAYENNEWKRFDSQ